MQNVVMYQYSMKQGVKSYGDKVKQAVLNELQQLHDQDVGEPVDKNTMGNDEIQCTLRYLIFLKEKRDGSIKGRGCADRRP